MLSRQSVTPLPPQLISQANRSSTAANKIRNSQERSQALREEGRERGKQEVKKTTDKTVPGSEHEDIG